MAENQSRPDHSSLAMITPCCLGAGSFPDKEAASRLDQQAVTGRLLRLAENLGSRKGPAAEGRITLKIRPESHCPDLAFGLSHAADEPQADPARLITRMSKKNASLTPTPGEKSHVP